jgi:hypothetical protein
MHFVYAIALVFATTFIHAACTVGVIVWVRPLQDDHWIFHNSVASTGLIAALVLLMSLVAYAEAALWAGFYVVVGALPTFSDAIYFSLVTFTTLGYGDITLPQEWRVLSAFQAANGIIMFGWTTAIIVAAVQRIFLHRKPQEAGA